MEEDAHVLAVAALSLDSTSSSSSSSSTTTSSSPSSSLTSEAFGATWRWEVEASSGRVSFTSDCTDGEKDRERGREEARESEVVGDGALLELATAMSLN